MPRAPLRSQQVQCQPASNLISCPSGDTPQCGSALAREFSRLSETSRLGGGAVRHELPLGFASEAPHGGRV